MLVVRMFLDGHAARFSAWRSADRGSRYLARRCRSDRLVPASPRRAALGLMLHPMRPAPSCTGAPMILLSMSLPPIADFVAILTTMFWRIEQINLPFFDETVLALINDSRQYGTETLANSWRITRQEKWISTSIIQ